MANFLDLLRTIFKLSGTQALPSLNVHSVQEGVGDDSGYISTISPVNGWLEVVCNSYSPTESVAKVRAVSVDSSGSDGLSASAIRQTISGVGKVDNCFPVCKGQTVKYLASSGVQFMLRWYATKGSDQ